MACFAAAFGFLRGLFLLEHIRAVRCRLLRFGFHVRKQLVHLILLLRSQPVGFRPKQFAAQFRDARLSFGQLAAVPGSERIEVLDQFAPFRRIDRRCRLLVQCPDSLT